MTQRQHMEEHVLPWFEAYIHPYKLVKEEFYLRGMSMLYWGAIVQNVEKAE